MNEKTFICFPVGKLSVLQKQKKKMKKMKKNVLRVIARNSKIFLKIRQTNLTLTYLVNPAHNS